MSRDGLHSWMNVARNCLRVLGVSDLPTIDHSNVGEMSEFLPIFLEEMNIDATTYTSAALQFLNSISFLLPGAPVKVCGSNLGMAVLPFLYPQNQRRDIFAIEISHEKATQCSRAFGRISEKFNNQVHFQAGDALNFLKPECERIQIVIVDVEIENSKDSYINFFEKLLTLPGNFLIVFHDAFVPEFRHVFEELEFRFDKAGCGNLLKIKTDENGFAIGYVHND